MAAEPSETYCLVWRAVRERQHILFDYNGRPRDVCPIILGRAADGREALKAYQVGGATSQGRLPAWRDFYLERIGSRRASPGVWQEGTSHKWAQTFVKFVDETLGAKHKAIIVPECGHNDRCVYTTESVLPVIFPK